MSGLTNATAVATGFDGACALLSTGGIDCWGTAAVLGNGTTTESLTPVAVSGITNATAVTAGDEHACALLSAGDVECWGYNGDGELGNGTTTDSSTPVPVSGITNATAVIAGIEHACAALHRRRRLLGQ